MERFIVFYEEATVSALTLHLLQNKCNVGYAFINMVSPLHIVSFYKVILIILIGVVLLNCTTLDKT